MRPSFVRFLPVVVLAAGLACLRPAAAQALPAPEIAPARLLKFTPQPGTAWYLESTADGLAWEQAGPFFSNGQAVRHVQPVDAPRQFRLRYIDPATIGHAPVMLEGTSLIMEKAGQPIEVVFMNAVRGMLRLDDRHARTFTYTWTKTSPDGGDAILSGTDGTVTLLRLNFSNAALGRWGMEDLPNRAAAASVAVPLDSGAFSFRQGRFRRGQENASLPTDLNGRSLVLNEAGRLSHLTFTGPATMTLRTPSGGTLDAACTWDPDQPQQGRLTLEFPDAPLICLDLDLLSPGAGVFTAPPPGDGTLPGRSGSFTLPDEQEPPPNPNCPPPGIAGLSLLINDSAPCTLTFHADGTGMVRKEVNGAMQFIPFLYTYSCTGGRSAKVTLTFPGGAGDAIDEFDMNWKDDCTGSFKRQSFANGSAAGTGTGTFGPGEGAGFPPAPLPGLGL